MDIEYGVNGHVDHIPGNRAMIQVQLSKAQSPPEYRDVVEVLLEIDIRIVSSMTRVAHSEIVFPAAKPKYRPKAYWNDPERGENCGLYRLGYQRPLM